MNIIYANKEQAKELITNDDNYLNEVNTFTIKTLCKKDNLDEFKVFLEKHVLEFSTVNIQKINNSINSFLPVLEEFSLNLGDIHFVLTSGKENFNLPYTRGNTIFLPKFMFGTQFDMMNRMNPQQDMFTHTIAHEMFHIISKRIPHIRNSLYEFLGFTLINEEITHQKITSSITNPDTCTGTNVVYNFNGDTLVGLIEKNTNLMSAMFMPFSFKMLNLTNNQVINLNPMQPNSYSSNFDTHYTYHPEEICAEYFASYLTSSNVTRRINDFISFFKAQLTE